MAQVIFVDIDDTICHRPDKTGLDYATSEPFPERIDRINKLYQEGNTIVYWAARGSKTGINWFSVTYEQLKKWGCQFHELRMGKPVYDIFIDDKNINSEDYFKI